MCYVHLVLENFYHSTTELVPKEIAMNTNRELPQYFIQRWQLAYMAQSLYLKLLLNNGLISNIFKLNICRKHQQRIKDGNSFEEEAD